MTKVEVELDDLVRVRDLLWHLEWSNENAAAIESRCPICLNWQHLGHKERCELGKAAAILSILIKENSQG